MAVSTIGRAAHTTRRVTARTARTTRSTRTTVTYISAGLLALGWAAVVVDALGADFLSSRVQLVILAALIAGTITLGRWYLVGGEMLYKAFRAGCDAERERQLHDVGKR